ncbi:unnamed protein product [Rangifer tarandus platyrhynchus]|uniref:Uncharacterized protein n=1 Tax=Rangifer tarandus platyrhynchus TaxID=3082113 RepID=A0ABN8ZXS4_RANTA|nr:unnamed protein product [Rangifer tarandus platyrhynchus]
MAICKVVVQFNQFSSQAADILLELPEPRRGRTPQKGRGLGGAGVRRCLTIGSGACVTSALHRPPPAPGKRRPLIGCAAGGLGANDRATSCGVQP